MKKLFALIHSTRLKGYKLLKVFGFKTALVESADGQKKRLEFIYTVNLFGIKIYL